MKITIRQEQKSDYKITENLITEAFKTASQASGNEALLVEKLRKSQEFIPALSLVEKLRKSQEFIPALSLVAENENKEVVGHVLFSLIEIHNENIIYQSLAIAPVSVKPEFQKQGIGGLLINEGHKIAKEYGYNSVILLGHPKYYIRFGYKPASQFNIKAPFPVPDEAFMAIELIPGSLSGISGIVKYPQEFDGV